MHSIPMTDISEAMRASAVAAVKVGPVQVEHYLYEAVQIMLEIDHITGKALCWQAKLLLLHDLMQPLLKPIEKHWRNKGRPLKASITFHRLTGEPGILVLETATGTKRTIYGRKGDGYCIPQ